MLEGQAKRGRGRPRKYPPKVVSDFESTKYDNFFNQQNRKAEEGKTFDIKNLVEIVFNSGLLRKAFPQLQAKIRPSCSCFDLLCLPIIIN